MQSGFKILLVEDMASFREAVIQLLGVYNDVLGVESLTSAKEALGKSRFDVVILDKSLPDGNGMSLISEIKDVNPNAVVIMLTSDSDFATVKQCISLGADDYVIKSENIIPDLLVRIPVAVSKAASDRRLVALEQQVQDAFKYEIVGKSRTTMQLRESILELRGTFSHVLILGESGTGKELVARRLNAIEENGKRPFVALNCGAIPENLLESELFGHKKGSFTGATQDRPGRFELAHNGDLFLDEIGELPLSAQVRLLRVIQEGEFTRVGDSRTIRVKCRIIAATNKDLELMVQKGEFREDLFHRLNVIQIQTTPLRKRNEDIADLSKTFALQIGGPSQKIDQRAIKYLAEYDWPGNIRELRNTIERACISTKRKKTNEITVEDISIFAPKDSSYQLRKIALSLPETLEELNPDNYKEFFDNAAKEYFSTALNLTNGNISELANKIGIGRSTVHRRILELGLKFKNKIKARNIRSNGNTQLPVSDEMRGTL